MKIANNWKDYKILDMAEGQKIRKMGRNNTIKTRPTNNMERKNISKNGKK